MNGRKHRTRLLQERREQGSPRRQRQAQSDETAADLLKTVTDYLGTGDFAPCEARAYQSGAAAYKARADAVSSRAAQQGWPEGVVVVSHG